MKNLGKIVLFIIFLIPNILTAGVVANVDSKRVSAGERVTLNLTITGEDINRPRISKICGTNIISSTSQTSIEMVNNEYKKSYVLSYQFAPTSSCTVESIEFEVDGVLETTKPIKIEVKEYKRSSNDDFILTLSSNKKEVYVGEPFELTLVFKQKRNAQAVDSKFVPPEFQGFWVKHESKSKRHNEGDVTITKVTYTLSAQRDGLLEINPAQMSIATRSNTRDTWGSFIPNVKWRKYLSNSLSITSKELPTGISLTGDFNIQVRVDKNEVDENEAVNVTVEVTGYGNLEDIKTFKQSISGVSVFDEKINIDGLLLTQKIALVGDKDFVIPSFKLTYFDLESKTVKIIMTEEIKIKVNSKEVKELVVKKAPKQSIEKEQVVVSKSDVSYLAASITLFVGLIIGLLIGLFKPWSILKREKKISLKEPKLLLIKLMPYKDDKKVATLMDALENSIYSDKKIEIDKKLLKEIVKKYEIS